MQVEAQAKRPPTLTRTTAGSSEEWQGERKVHQGRGKWLSAVPMVAIGCVGHDGRNPDGVGTKPSNVIQLIDDALERAAAVIG